MNELSQPDLDLFYKPEIVKEVLNSLSSHIVLLDEHGTIVAVNKSWQIFLEINDIKYPKFGLFTNYIDFAKEKLFANDEYSNRIGAALREIIDGNIKYFSMIYAGRDTTAGSWYIVVVTPFENSSLHAGVVVSHRDITEQVLTKDKLSKSEAKYQYLFDHASDGIFLFDENLNIKNANEAASNQVGYSLSELTNLTVNDLFFAEDLKIRPIKIKELNAGQNIINERNFKRKDGSFLAVEINSKKLPNGTYQGICRDISERRRNEKLLARKENYIHNILSADPECIKLISEDGLYLSINQAGLGILEVPSEKQIIGESVLTYICPEYHSIAIKQLQKAFKGESGILEYQITTFLGNKKWLEGQAVPFKDLDGNIESCLWISRDISERIKAKEALQKSHKRLKKSFANIQSIIENERKEISRELHDELGQKLTALNFDISWLSKKFQPDNFAEKKVILEMKEILDSLLESVQRISKNLRPPILEQLEFEDIVHWLISDFEKRSNISCSLEMSVENAGKVESVKVNIFRILQESLTNILRHSNASHVKVIIHESENQLSVTVSDDGLGISEDKLINSNSLGLIGMQERVESLQGSFSITGNPGSGTKIEATVPIIYVL